MSDTKISALTAGTAAPAATDAFVTVENMATTPVSKRKAWSVLMDGIYASIHAATSKATPVDADEVGLWDSVTGLLNRLTWANVKATLKTYFDSIYPPAFPNRNAIINGGMTVAQRGAAFTSATTPANSDDTYLLDRWILLSDGNDIVDVTQVTTPVPVGSYAALCADIETEDKKFGFLTVLKARDSARLIGKTVSLSFKARMGASDTSTLLRAAILAWSSTADTVTSDIVNAWGDEGTNPTLVANWTFENTPAALAELTDAYQTFKIENIAIDTASTTNIAVFIWSEDKTNAVGDLVYITDVQLELASAATPFEFRLHTQELELCKNYCRVMGGSSVYESFGAGYIEATNLAIIILSLSPEMRTAPTLSISAASDFRVSDAAFTAALNALTVEYGSSYGVSLVATQAGTTFTVGNAAKLYANNTLNARFILSAEL